MSQNKRSTPAESEPNPPSKRQHEGEQLLERGYLYIFYRQKVDAEEAEDLSDVQRLYFITIPQSTSDSQGGNRPAGRVFAIPKKLFPEVERHDKFSCIVDGTFQTLDDAKNYLKEAHYTTKTRGERVNLKATLVAAGAYGISYLRNRSHFIVALDQSSPEQVEQSTCCAGVIVVLAVPACLV